MAKHVYLVSHDMKSHHKSDVEVTWLVCEVIQALDFDIPDLAGFNASSETAQFDAVQKKIPPEDIFGIDRWKCMTINISVPTREKEKDGNGQIFSVESLLHRSILDVVQVVFLEALSKTSHLTPFKRVWKSPVTSCDQHVYNKLYVSDTWNQAQDEIVKQRRDDGCTLERVVTGLMFWSNSTRLAQFEHASAWPIYLFFNNLSKYTWADPQSGYCHLITFIPSVRQFLFVALLWGSHCIGQLLESIKKLLSLITNKKNNCDLMTHCKQELVHAIWKILLNDDFVEAYKNSIVVYCFNGVTRRVYPRIFIYSADYPEKWVILLCLLSEYWTVWRIIVATIQDKGNCPCPCCLIPKAKFHCTRFVRNLAARLSQAWTYLVNKIQLAQQAIYVLGRPLKGMMVETILKGESLVPTLVRMLFVIWCISVKTSQFSLEFFLWATLAPGIRIVPNPGSGLTAWVWVWHSEVHFALSALNNLCHWFLWDWHTQRTVRSTTLQ